MGEKNGALVRARGFEPVTQSADRRDKYGIRRVTLDARTQAFDMYIKCLRITDVVVTPYALDEAFTSDNATGV